MVYSIEYKRPYSRIERNKNLDGDPRLVRLVDETFEAGLIIQPGSQALIAGRPIDPTHLPRTMLIGGGLRAVTDYDQVYGVDFISERLKELIEALEPGVHQFFPLELVDASGGHLADHWSWIVCNRIDSVDRTHTTAILHKGLLWRPASDLSASDLPPGIDPSLPPHWVFNSAQVGCAQFWRDKYLPGSNLYCSDEAANLILAAGLTGIKLTEMEEV